MSSYQITDLVYFKDAFDNTYWVTDRVLLESNIKWHGRGHTRAKEAS